MQQKWRYVTTEDLSLNLIHTHPLIHSCLLRSPRWRRRTVVAEQVPARDEMFIWGQLAKANAFRSWGGFPLQFYFLLCVDHFLSDSLSALVSGSVSLLLLPSSSFFLSNPKQRELSLELRLLHRPVAAVDPTPSLTLQLSLWSEGDGYPTSSD